METLKPVPGMPPELLRPIFEDLANDKFSLCALSLSSSIFREEAQRILFGEATGLETAEAHLNFLRVVISSPTRLALLVHVYIPTGRHELDDELLDAMCQALEAMRNLRCLDLKYVHNKSAVWATSRIISLIAHGCTFSLTRLDFDIGSLYGDDIELLKGLSSHQRTLKHLGLGYRDPMAPPPTITTTYSHLVSLEGDWDTIKALLRGHEIRTLSIMPMGMDPRDADIRLLMPKLKRIEAFSYMPLRRPIPEQMESVLQNCSSMTVFELADFEEADLKDFLPRMVPKFATLHTLILSRVVEPDKTPEEHQIHGLFDLGRSLQRIDILIIMRPPTYARHLRHTVSAPEVVSEFEVRKLWLAL